MEIDITKNSHVGLYKLISSGLVAFFSDENTKKVGIVIIPDEKHEFGYTVHLGLNEIVDCTDESKWIRLNSNELTLSWKGELYESAI